MDANEKKPSLAPLVTGFTLGVLCGLAIRASRGRDIRAWGRRRRLKGAELYARVKHLLPDDCAPSIGGGPMTPQELAEEFDLTANL